VAFSREDGFLFRSSVGCIGGVFLIRLDTSGMPNSRRCFQPRLAAPEDSFRVMPDF